jgi:hypothetical protein
VSLRTVLSVLLAAMTTVACGDAYGPSPVTPSTATPTQAPTPSPTVAWETHIENDEQAVFGVAIRLDGEEIYRADAANATHHVGHAERPFVAGMHTVEYEVLSTGRPQHAYPYTPRLHVAISNGPGTFADGVPKNLRVGERLTVTLRLQ